MSWLERAPGLDVAVGWFTALPLVLGSLLGYVGTGGSIFGGVVGLGVGWLAMMVFSVGWCWWDERRRKDALTGERIVSTLNKSVGRVRNHAALWATALAVPVFWCIRLAQVVAYPLVVWLVKLPRYEHAEYVNISRHKFEGLVGHDLVWCLYCDWMTGVWSLGTEMLRNVESYWCPIRFSDATKCEKCAIEFPDVNTTWVGADGTMDEVTAVLRREHAEGNHSWHGHPSRLTVEGVTVESVAVVEREVSVVADEQADAGVAQAADDGEVERDKPAAGEAVNDRLERAADDLLRLEDEDDRKQ